MSKNPNNEHKEIDDYDNIELSDNPIEEKDIYENGKIFKITIRELITNEVALKQLINTYNITKRELINLRESNKNKDVEIGLLKVSPFIAIISIVMNILFTVLLSFSINILTGDKKNIIGISLLIVGIIGELVGNLIPIIYPFVISIIKNEEKNSST